MTINRSEYISILGFHTIFFTLSLSLFLSPLSSGVIFLLVVTIYNITIPTFALLRGKKNLLDIWLYSFLLSLLQIIPDWILSALLNVLVFPEDGVFNIGDVSGYMAGLWTIPFLLIIYTGLFVLNTTQSVPSGIISAAISGLVIFGLSEMTLWKLGSWYAQNVESTLHVAHYIIFPELLLSMVVFAGYVFTRHNSWVIRYLIIWATMIFYTGSAVISYFFMEYL